jgi:perosamine synthetase
MDPVVNRAAKRFIPVAEPSIGKREVKAVAEVVESGWISQGQVVNEFEQIFANFHDTKYGSACTSGTTALHLALAVCDISRGDEVIIPDFTMVALANSTLLSGGTPVFADVVGGVGNLSLDCIKEKITDKTTVVIVVHTYGEPIDDIVEISKYLNKRGIFLIEDCAEAHYAVHKSGGKVGSFGDLAIFSFYANKNITTGEGGLVITDNKDVKDRLDRIRMHAFTPGKHFCHTERAFGYRMTNMQAAMGIEQHRRHEEFMLSRWTLRQRYENNLKGVSCIEIPETTKSSAWWIMPILADGHRDSLRAALADNGIETRSYFYPMHTQSFLTQYDLGEYPQANRLSQIGFYLPLNPTLSVDDIDYISEVIVNYDLEQLMGITIKGAYESY